MSRWVATALRKLPREPDRSVIVALAVFAIALALTWTLDTATRISVMTAVVGVALARYLLLAAHLSDERLQRIEKLVERIADAVAPVSDRAVERREAERHVEPETPREIPRDLE
jgi:hypothetical protein